ncbi:tripartite tricarboxylate transporter substrate binding protein [Pseudonocardia pini]|uniref:tripartite tricarboxylate transporter substrate binding protein n=1 Tax=Pseudonocardia pini TaxID=2758030 RepID=UPI0015F01083|nr:tripartite tricarboxylate transporter substrate binding protein [Pseudonocardia pini]
MTPHRRRGTTTVLAGALAVLAVVLTGCATPPVREYPYRTVRIIAPFAAGGISDLTARVAAECLEAATDEKFVVENKPGGGGTSGMSTMVRSKPDGYTLAVATLSTSVLVPQVSPEAGYTGADVAPVGALSLSPSVLVVAGDSRWRTASDFVGEARERPDTLSVAMPGAQGVYSLTMDELGRAGSPVRKVPFESNDLSVTAVVGDNVDAAFVATSSTLLQQLADGRVRALATGAERRLGFLPEVPTFAESGVAGLPESGAYVLLAAPVGVPEPVLARLESIVRDCTSDPGFAARVGPQFVLPAFAGRAEVGRLFQESAAEWRAALLAQAGPR